MTKEEKIIRAIKAWMKEEGIHAFFRERVELAFGLKKGELRPVIEALLAKGVLRYSKKMAGLLYFPADLPERKKKEGKSLEEWLKSLK